MYDALHAMKKGMKDALAPQGLFEDLGLKYVGPVDGHDRAAVEQALRPGQAVRRPGDRARDHPQGLRLRRRPSGTRPTSSTARARSTSRPARRTPRAGSGPTSSPTRWSRSARERQDVVGDHRRDDAPGRAATSSPRAYPERTFDVGIAEQHAATSAAGLAMGGLHPVVAVYATFLNRAFDQVLMDVALHRCGVTFVLDRSGVTGDDGASHNGMWDMSILQVVPGLRLAAPRDAARLRELLREAVAGRRRPDRRAVPQGPPPSATSRPSTGPAAATCWSATAPRTC